MPDSAELETWSETVFAVDPPHDLESTEIVLSAYLVD